MSSAAPNWTESTPEWAKSLPLPKSNPEHIDASEVAELIHTKQHGIDYVVVDLRKADWETAYVRTSINIPVQSLHQSLPTLLPLLCKVPIIIFYCKACSITSRGARGASYYQDALDAAGIKTSQARILTSGIQGWIAKYSEDESLTVKIQ